MRLRRRLSPSVVAIGPLRLFAGERLARRNIEPWLIN
jgi:hypothetical protein